MTKNVLLCGVGSQDTILASRLMALTAIEKEMKARGTKTVGVIQRDGSVVSHMRIDEEIYSPLIPHGGAGVIIGFEPVEAVRCLPYPKGGGCVVISPAPIRPVTASPTRGAYTSRKIMEYLKHVGRDLVVVSAASIGMERGPLKAMSVILLGITVTSGLIRISLKEMEAATEKRMPEKLKDVNMKTLKLGAAAGAMIG